MFVAVNPLFLTDRNLLDMNPIIAGQQVCPPGHGTHPHIRQYMLLHFVYSGSGTLQIQGREHSVQAGQVFLITPGVLCSYCADTTDPWHYGWIGFTGRLAGRFSELPAVFQLSSELMALVRQSLSDPDVTEYRLAGVLLRLYETLISNSGDANRYVQQIENYIRLSYMQPIRVEQLAKQLNLDRRYLTRLFKQSTGLSIQDYLLKIRLQEADKYLRQGRSVKEAAGLSGYGDVSNFSKLFKRHYGITPAQRRHTP